MKKRMPFLWLPAWLCLTVTTQAQRFPKPDFESGYQYPAFTYPVPRETLWMAVDLTLLVVLMGIVAWAVIRKRTRQPVMWTSVISVGYFGFFRNGCVCSIGAIQNVALALADESYVMPLSVLLFFMLPIVFTLLFGRVFCAGVCPFGAIQELIHIRNHRLPVALRTLLGMIPWIYLAMAVLFAVTRSGFILCRFDPFIGIFRLGGNIGLIVCGAALLVAAMFTGRPFCRFLCPYGALLGVVSRVSIWKMKITPECINCELCHQACPVDAIRPPFDNRIKESRTDGVKRILRYLFLLPLMMGIGAWIMRQASDTFSYAHKDVRLFDMVMQYERETPSDELEAFYGQGGTVEALTGRVEKVRSDFRRASTGVGLFIGLVIGLTLLSLSLKRTRKTYETDDAACVNCGRCFRYCPPVRSLKSPLTLL